VSETESGFGLLQASSRDDHGALCRDDVSLERSGRAHLQAEAAQDPAQVHLHIVELRLDQLARAQKPRTSCVGSDLQCTGRNQPSRSSWVIPRASFLSVLTGMALKAPRTLEKRVRAMAKTDERVRLLMSTPGAGAIVAFTMSRQSTIRDGSGLPSRSALTPGSRRSATSRARRM
jgi:hypothetical protein